MIIRKANPVGVDVVIDNIQTLLYDNLQWTDYKSYGRARVNETNDGEMWEAWDVGNDYKEVLLDDNFAATSFFVVQPARTFGERWKSNISVIFQINANRIYEGVPHYADEEALNDVCVILQNQPGFDVTGSVDRIRDVYREINYGTQVFDNLAPYYVFRVNIEANYDQDCCLNNCTSKYAQYIITEDGINITDENGRLLLVE